MKQKFFLLLFATIASVTVLAAQSVAIVDETTFQQVFDGLLVLLTTAVTFLVKNQIIKSTDAGFVEKILKNTYVVAGIVFSVIAFIFVKFGFTAANAFLAVKFVAANLLAIFWSSAKPVPIEGGEANQTLKK